MASVWSDLGTHGLSWRILLSCDSFMHEHERCESKALGTDKGHEFGLGKICLFVFWDTRTTKLITEKNKTKQKHSAVCSYELGLWIRVMVNFRGRFHRSQWQCCNFYLWVFPLCLELGVRQHFCWIYIGEIVQWNVITCTLEEKLYLFYVYQLLGQMCKLNLIYISKYV